LFYSAAAAGPSWAGGGVNYYRLENHQMRKIISASLLVLALALVGTAAAGKVGQAKLWIYNPSAGEAVAQWTKGGLSLEKNAPTTAELAAGAELKGVAGETLTTLAFDVNDASYCNAGAPRFNVYSGGSTYFFGCSYGVHTPLGNGWTHVEFKGSDLGAAAGATIDGIEVVMDEEGATLLRNITVNDLTVDKFSN